MNVADGPMWSSSFVVIRMIGFAAGSPLLSGHASNVTPSGKSKLKDNILHESDEDM